MNKRLYTQSTRFTRKLAHRKTVVFDFTRKTDFTRKIIVLHVKNDFTRKTIILTPMANHGHSNPLHVLEMICGIIV